MPDPSAAPEAFATEFTIHRATPGRHARRDWFLAFPGDRLELVPENGRETWRLVFTGCTLPRSVGECRWDGEGGPLEGHISFATGKADGQPSGEKASFHISAHFHIRDGRTYMSAILMPDRRDAVGDRDDVDPTDDPCATGGWTAQAQGGGKS